MGASAGGDSGDREAGALRAVPARFVGAWRRTELRVDGELVGPDADADVLWLQAATWYADLRIPRVDDGGPVETFAGPARWCDPTFTWEHHLDWVGTFPSDEGTFEVDGDDLVERGSFVDGHRQVVYVERWVRASTATDHVVAHGGSADGRAVLVEVGSHRLVLVDARVGGRGFSVRRDDRVDGRWGTTFARGPESAAPVVRRDGPVDAVGGAITFGAWTLTVTELGGRA